MRRSTFVCPAASSERAVFVRSIGLQAATVALALLAGGCNSIRTYDEPGGLVVYDAGPGGAPDGAI